MVLRLEVVFRFEVVLRFDVVWKRTRERTSEVRSAGQEDKEGKEPAVGQLLLPFSLRWLWAQTLVSSRPFLTFRFDVVFRIVVLISVDVLLRVEVAAAKPVVVVVALLLCAATRRTGRASSVPRHASNSSIKLLIAIITAS